MTIPEHRFHRFLNLAGLELILAGAWTLFIAVTQNLTTTTILAAVTLLVGIACFIVPIFITSRASEIASALSGRLGQLGALFIPAALSAFLFLRGPSIEALQIIGVLVASMWLIGIEVLFFFHTPKETTPLHTTSSRLAVLSILLGYGILLIPSRAPSLLDGFPWNTPLEFISATLILPFAFFFGRKFLSHRGVTLLLTLMLLAKLGMSFFIPQSGLGIHAYSSEDALNSGKWDRTYGSFLEPSYSEVMKIPYKSFYDLPIEFINSHGYKRETFWLAIEFNGTISMNEDERLVVLVQGASERTIELTDLATGEVLNVAVAKSAEDLGTDWFEEIPYIGKAGIKGSLLFTSYGNGRFEPVLLRSDGSIRSALPQIWLSPDAMDLPTSGFQLAFTGISLILLVILLFSILDGLRILYQSGFVNNIDLYLGLTSLVLYYLVDTSGKPGIQYLILATVFILFTVKFLDQHLHSRAHFPIGYLFSIGLPILLMFLPLDLLNVQNVVQIPQYQDAMEYQWLARNIYVGGDAFLFQSPPWAYKVLYPYVIGLLHILFGQSLSAQFFLSIWSALLTAILTIELAVFFGLSNRLSFVIAGAFLLIISLPSSFIYFFRFGLIEPLAITTLLLGAHYAKEGKFGAMFVTGVVTGMLRLNFAGAIFTSITFLDQAFVGGFSQAWGAFVNWLRLSWKRWVPYLVAIPLPSLFIAFIYSLVKPGYTLTHEMNDQTSIGSVLLSITRVVFGGDEDFLRDQIQSSPIDLVLITFPILFGLVIALISLMYRKGIFEKIDLRLSLFLLSMLPVYMVLKPVGYFPRYSWSFLPPALILIALVLQFTLLRDNKALQETK